LNGPQIDGIWWADGTLRQESTAKYSFFPFSPFSNDASRSPRRVAIGRASMTFIRIGSSPKASDSAKKPLFFFFGSVRIALKITIHAANGFDIGCLSRGELWTSIVRWGGMNSRSEPRMNLSGILLSTTLPPFCLASWLATASRESSKFCLFCGGLGGTYTTVFSRRRRPSPEPI